MKALVVAAAILVALLMLGGLVCIYLAIWVTGEDSLRWGTTAFVSIVISIFGSLGVMWLWGDWEP